jgi:hypothetical protein
MKRIFLLSVFLFSIAQLTFGQNLEIIPYMSYQWGGKMEFYEGDMKFQSSENYGIALNYGLPSGTILQLEYMNQSTSLDVRLYEELGSDYKSYPVSMNWIQVGGLQGFDFYPLVPFAGITLGALNFNPRTNELQDAWKFALTGQLGLKYYFSERIGIRLHARLLMPIQWAGFGVSIGTGGAGAGINAGSYIFQGDIGGGLIFNLGPIGKSE